jgi:LruC domain-containing protein
MFGGSMIQTGVIDDVYSMKVRSTSDIYSVFKCTGNIPEMRYAASEFNGKIELVHALLVDGSGTNGRVRYESMFGNNGSVLSKTQTKNVLATTCNNAAGQIETPPPAIVDNDGDGVAAEFDVDDNDASVAFVSYFPSASTWGTYAFEDLWPVKGDYDVNDLVLGFRISYFSNASNLVSKLRFEYNMRAAGSTYSLAAAFQLDNISASNIASVTGQNMNGTSPLSVNTNGTENGVSLAVIPLFNSQKDVVSYTGYLNTESGSYVITPDKSVNIRFSSPVQQSTLAMSSFNLFIIANSRGNEIHLPTFRATTKFDSSLAAGSQLYPGDNFKYIDGMMWGLMIPETFQYPLESNTIISAYPHFGEWATSGGTTYTDWYKPLSGYINEQFIFVN